MTNLNEKIRAQISALTGLAHLSETVTEDVFIVGHPKSGNTWFQNLVAGVIYGVDPEYAPYALIRDLVPGHLPKYYKRYATPMFFKSHHSPRPQYQRVIYLVRDGRDVMVSYFHHLRAGRNKTVDFLKVVQGQEVPWPYKWHEHVESWLSNPHQAQMLLIKYEDLKHDTVKELQRFCGFVGVERDETFLQHVARKASFETLRKKEINFGIAYPNWSPEQLFMRRGQVGSHKDEMPAEVLEVFLRDAGDTLRKLGYM